MRGRWSSRTKVWRVATCLCSVSASNRARPGPRRRSAASRAHRCIRVADDVGGVALLIDVKNERAARWYQSYGALALDDAPLSLVLPLATAADAIKRGI